MSLIHGTRAGSIVLYQGDVRTLLFHEASQGAKLVIADPPWSYANSLNGSARNIYLGHDIKAICATLEAAYHCAAEDAYLLLWWTWPQLSYIWPRMLKLPWRYLTGGVWTKPGMGVGFHVRGDSEPWALLAKGKPKPTHKSLRNVGAAPRRRHSEKPVEVLTNLIEGLSQPGDKVLSLYSGLFPEGRACLKAGRQCVGAELDPDRYELASKALVEAWMGREAA